MVCHVACYYAIHLILPERQRMANANALDGTWGRFPLPDRRTDHRDQIWILCKSVIWYCHCVWRGLASGKGCLAGTECWIEHSIAVASEFDDVICAVSPSPFHCWYYLFGMWLSELQTCHFVMLWLKLQKQLLPVLWSFLEWKVLSGFSVCGHYVCIWNTWPLRYFISITDQEMLCAHSIFRQQRPKAGLFGLLSLVWSDDNSFQTSGLCRIKIFGRSCVGVVYLVSRLYTVLLLSANL